MASPQIERGGLRIAIYYEMPLLAETRAGCSRSQIPGASVGGFDRARRAALRSSGAFPLIPRRATAPGVGRLAAVRGRLLMRS
jgi:hypothetical protein